MKRVQIITLLCLVLTETMAWGPTGHRSVGLIAEQHLGVEAKGRLKELFGHETLANVSTWMDEIKGDPAFDYMRSWHWVKIDSGSTYGRTDKNPKGDLIVTVERVIKELSSGDLDKKDEIINIKILVHLIGDIHMPLHAGWGEDRGGVEVKVKWHGRDSHLHWVWDRDMIDETQYSYTELVQSLGRPDHSTVVKWQNSNVRGWAVESMSYHPQVYDFDDINLGREYSYKNLGIVKQRLVQAGVRLAGVLNQIYAK